MRRQQWKKAFAATLASLIASCSQPITVAVAQTTSEMLALPAGLQGFDLRSAAPPQHLPFAHFNIPFDIEPSGQPPAEVVLWVSADRGRSWIAYGSTSPEKRAFEFRAAAEGEYLFAVQTRDTRGDTRLAAGPPMRILIDTSRPILEMVADLNSSGRITVDFQITDANLSESSVRLASSIDSSNQWQDVNLGSLTQDGNSWRGRAEMEMPRCRELDFKLVASDKAQNNSEQVIRYQTPRTAAATTGMQLASSGVADIRALDARPNEPRTFEPRGSQSRTDPDNASRAPRIADARLPGNLNKDQNLLVVGAPVATQPKELSVPTASASASSSRAMMPANTTSRLPSSGIPTSNVPTSHPAIAVQPQTQSSGKPATAVEPLAPTQGGVAWVPNARQPSAPRFEGNNGSPRSDIAPSGNAVSNFPTAPISRLPGSLSDPTTSDTRGVVDSNSLQLSSPTSVLSQGVRPTNESTQPRDAAIGIGSLTSNAPKSIEAQRGIPTMAGQSAEELPPPVAVEDRIEANRPQPVATRSTVDSLEDAWSNRSKVNPFEAANDATSTPRDAQRIGQDSTDPAGAAPTASAIIEDTTNLPTSFKDAHHSRSRSFSLDYAIDSLRGMTVADIELWGTEDRGNTWQKWGSDPDRESPFDVQVGNDGLFGFRMVIIGENGMVSNKPHDGDPADMWINVDTKMPTVKITRAMYGEGAEAGMLVIDYSCDDDNLHDRPITFSYSERPTGPWTTIASGVRNSGIYLWKADPNLPQQVYLRVQAVDRAGNVEEHRLELPINLRGLTPRGRIQGFRPITP